MFWRILLSASDNRHRAAEDGSFFLKFMENIYGDFFKVMSGISESLDATKNDFKNMNFAGAESAIKGACYTLITICFLVDLIQNVLLKADELRMEDVIKSVIKLVVAKNVFSETDKLLKGFSGMANSICGSLNKVNANKFPNAADMIDLSSSDYDNALDVIIDVAYFAGHIIEFLTIILATWGTRAILVARGFEMKLLEIVSPIPMSFLPWSETKDIPKKFLLNYFAICLQGVVIIICSIMFVNILSDGKINYIKVQVYSIVYLLALFKSGTTAKQLLGVG